MNLQCIHGFGLTNAEKIIFCQMNKILLRYSSSGRVKVKKTQHKSYEKI